MSIPHPVPCVKRDNAVDVRKRGLASGNKSRRKRSAIARATVAEQFTLEMMAT
jgi:hypothetical protein